VHRSKSGPLKFGQGQERRISAVRNNISALPPRTDVGADIVEQPVTARSGCEQSEQSTAYSITSSARAKSVGGISRPSTFAVLRLITKSYLVGACTGRSLGFSPLKIRCT
jgi:hypothetical protein